MATAARAKSRKADPAPEGAEPTVDGVPGLRAAQGILVALAISVPLWLVIAGVLVWLFG